MSGIPFFISYIFVAGIVMTNVVVAILLEKYLEATQNHDKEIKADADAEVQPEEVDEEDDDGQLPVSGSSTAEELTAVKTKDLVSTHHTTHISRCALLDTCCSMHAHMMLTLPPPP
jgi:hypothetical protein